MTTQELVLKNLERLAANNDRPISDILKLARVNGSIVYGGADAALDVNAVGRIAGVMNEPVFAFFLYDTDIIASHAEALGYERVDPYREKYEALLVKYSEVMEKIISLKESAAVMKETANKNIDKMRDDLSEIIGDK